MKIAMMSKTHSLIIELTDQNNWERNMMRLSLS